MTRRSLRLRSQLLAMLLMASGWLGASGFASEQSSAGGYVRQWRDAFVRAWCPAGDEPFLFAMNWSDRHALPVASLIFPAEFDIKFVLRKSGGYRCEVRIRPTRE